MRKNINLDRLVANSKPKFLNEITTPLLVSLIALIGVVLSFFLNFYLIEKNKLTNEKQYLLLEKIKTDLAVSSQTNSELITKIDLARLALERQVALKSLSHESKRVEIEDKGSKREEAKLSIDFTKLLNDLRPNLEATCKYESINKELFKLDCSYFNKSLNKVTLIPKNITLLDPITQKPLHNAIAKIENFELNNILSGGKGSNTYDIFLSEESQNLKNYIIRFSADANTDNSAIVLTKRLSNGVLTDLEILNASLQSYTFNFKFKIDH